MLWGVAIVLVVALAGSMGAMVAALELAPPGVGANVRDGSTDVAVTSPIRIVPQGWSSRVDGATLWETPMERDGSRGASREVPLQLQSVREGWQPGSTEVALRPVRGALLPDGEYRLALRGTALEMALPTPRPTPWERELRFTTPPSPRPIPAPDATSLKWEQPLAVRWSTPIDDFQVKATPSAQTRAWVDPADRRLSYVVIESPEDAQAYEVAVTGAQGTNGITLQHPTTYKVIAPTRPKLEGERKLTTELDAPIALRWNVPMERIAYQIDPPVPSRWERDPRDPSVTQLRLQELEQGATYEIKVIEARSRDGAPLEEPRTVTVQTPRRLLLEDVEVGTSGGRASVSAKPVIVFSQPIRDRGAAEAAIGVEPQTPGRFEWLDDSRVRFVPSRPFPYESKVTFTVKPGLNGPRSTSGAYFEREPAVSFATEIDKIIDVDVTKQVMRLISQGRVVHTFPVGTGVPGADTPLGEFNVQYKMPTARFRGTNVTGATYDLADVKWVMSFQGDYTIHGVYWRGGFGSRSSNGCVGLSDANAKTVYDWTPEGTLVKIHY